MRNFIQPSVLSSTQSIPQKLTHLKHNPEFKKWNEKKGEKKNLTPHSHLRNEKGKRRMKK